MRSRLALSVAALAVLAAPVAHAQAVSGLGAVYNASKTNLIKAAEQVPEEHYGFKPTPEVRSFGQLVGHVANANYMICSMATGAQNPNSTNFEQSSAKTALVEGIKASFAYCDTAYEMADAKGMEVMKLFGMDTNRMGVLAFNAGHNFEHYGNMVTYMRLKGMVPPSSQR